MLKKLLSLPQKINDLIQTLSDTSVAMKYLAEKIGEEHEGYRLMVTTLKDMHEINKRVVEEKMVEEAEKPTEADLLY